MKISNLKKSEEYFKKAKQIIPGGVNSPVRAFKAVGMNPLFIKRAKGACIYDADGNEYIDYVLSWGPMILGHADERVLKPVAKTMKQGTTFGAPTKAEVDLAELVGRIFPSIEKVRLTSSGTEAAMSAIRLARGFTGKEKIIKFQGCYHGHFDSLLVKAGSGAATFGVPSSAGVNKSFAEDTIALPFNNLELVRDVIRKEKNIACIIVEPVPANMGVVLPKEGFLKGLREITQENNIVLIFDEVITGFRVALGGAQQLFDIKPDLTVLGKIIGGGFPIGAFGGKSKIMNFLSPEGPVYQAGTLSGNPVAVTAGITTLKILLRERNIYLKLDSLGEEIESGLNKIINRSGYAIKINRCGSLFTLFFTDKTCLNNYDDVAGCDLKKFAAFFKGMLQEGIYLAPSQFEANFLSIKHNGRNIKKTLKAAEVVLRTID